MTVLVLGFAFYNAYSKSPSDKPKKENSIDCACETEPEQKKNFINSKKFLWIVTIVSALLITFPYYSKAFFPDSGNNIIIVQSDNIVKVKMEIEGMTCTGCEESVNYVLKSESGIISALSSYKTGIVDVEYDKTQVNPQQLKKAVEDKVGYKVKKIENIAN